MRNDNVAEGSSPRVRGAGTVPTLGQQKRGIIPARAGSSLWRLEQSQWTWDHPRACGEQAFALRTVWKKSGSSPRVRGAVVGNYMSTIFQGIIPARAGSSKG